MRSHTATAVAKALLVTPAKEADCKASFFVVVLLLLGGGTCVDSAAFLVAW